MIRANSRLRKLLGESGLDFLTHGVGAIERILPHVQVTRWTEVSWEKPESVWTSDKKTEIRMTIAIGDKGDPDRGSLTTRVQRRSVPVVGGLSLPKNPSPSLYR